VSRDENFPDGIVLRPAPEGLLADPSYRAGLAELGRRGLTYDAMLYHSQISELAAAAQAVPDTMIILDHLGCILGVGPYEGQGSRLFAGWRDSMRRLADCPNVVVKMGGFGMIICGARWHEAALPPSSTDLADAWRPYIETCTELFGAERCMFESNFPVDKAMYSYRTLWNSFKKITHGWPEADRAMLFSGTARRIYRLDDTQSSSAHPSIGAAHA
jgi:predicted TIM-barrel fold metal-dependent hydrolase